MKHHYAIMIFVTLTAVLAIMNDGKALENVEGSLMSFLGVPAFDVQDLFAADRFPTVAVAMDGTVLAFWDGVIVRRSEDGGASWEPEIIVGEGFMGGGVTVDETTGAILAFVEESHPPAPLTVYRSQDHGKTWHEQETTIIPNGLGHVPSMHMNEHGITLRHGAHQGRLIRPSRWYDESNAREFWPNHYTNAVFSDNGGKTWQASEPFPERGTGEACIVELSDGTLYYNSRRHWAPDPEDARNRWAAWSKDGGKTWTDHQKSDILPDGNTDTTYGLMGGLVRLPVKGRDILIFSNIVSDEGRRNGHLWASFDGGNTWPITRTVEPGSFAYSSLNAGRPGTPSEGWIYLLYEAGRRPGSSGRMARFNLSWLIEGESTGDGEVPAWVSDCAPDAITPGAQLYVSPDGDDNNPGTADAPFNTLERARDEIRTKRQEGLLAEGAVVVNVMPGEYPVRKTFELTAEDSGEPEAPIIYRGTGAHKSRFSGGVRLSRFTILEDADTLARLPESARGYVWEADLVEAGVTELIPFKRGGFAGGRGFTTHPEMELFVDGAPMTVAQWPNDGFVLTGEVTGPLTLVSWDNRPGAEQGRFLFEDERLARWAEEPNGWLYGYWYWNWADSYEKIDRIDLENQKIVLAEPWHSYGYRKNQRFQAVNMLCELDEPGQWYMDHERKRAYVYPTKDLNAADVVLSVTDVPLIQLNNASHLRFQGLLWEYGAADGIRVQGGKDCRFEGCTLRKMAGNGLVIHGGANHMVQSCDIHTMGRGGIVMSGGDRKTLAPGNNRVENCHIHHLSRIDRTYTPGVLLSGVGNRIRNNLIHNVASSALRVGGNDHLIERNEVHSVVLESDDQGAVDMWGNATYRGIVFRHNYWHHLGNWQAGGAAASSERGGIRLDDAISGVLIEGNVFQRVCATPTWFGAVQIHGGKDNIIQGNLVLDSGAAFSFTTFSGQRWRDFVADALDDPAIDKELYLERYPKLAQLKEGENEVLLRDNVMVRCDALFLREHDAIESVDNRVYPESNAFQTEPGERLSWSADEAEELGVTNIPFDKIGLYEDKWRRLEQ